MIIYKTILCENCKGSYLWLGENGRFKCQDCCNEKTLTKEKDYDTIMANPKTGLMFPIRIDGGGVKNELGK